MKNTDTKLECIEGHVFNESELKFPYTLLDDDYPDYGGDCPFCSANMGEGEVWQFEGDSDVREPYAIPAFPSVADSIATVLVVLSMVAFGGLLMVVGGMR